MAARGAYVPNPLLRGPAERTRNENSGGVFGTATPGIRGRGRGRGRGGALHAEVKEEVVERAEPGAVAGSGSVTTNVKKSTTAVSAGEDKKTVKARATTERKSTFPPAKKGEPVIVSSEDEGVAEEGPRRDIETIEISSSEEEDAAKGFDDEEEGLISTKARGKRRQNENRQPRAKISLRPVRAPRDTRENNELDGFSSRKKVQRSVRDRDKDYGQGAEDAIEGEPVDNEDDMDIDEGGQGPSVQGELVSLEARNKNKGKKGLAIKDPKIASETIEERAERLRYAEDVRKLRRELSGLAPVMAPTEDIDAMEPERLDQSAEKGQLYLFQFPPLTPMLVDPAQSDEIQIKQEHAVEIPNSNPAPPAQSGVKGKEKEKGPQIKKEEDAKEEVKAQAQVAAEKAKVLTADGGHLPSGVAGKLNVHQSGKVTLEWGGTNLEVRWGSEVDFLQDIVLTDGGSGDAEGAEKAGKERDAFALGQVQKKIVVIPDWQKIYE